MTRRVLTIRTDAIGDAILWSGAIERLHALFPEARHGMLCRHSVAPVYASCPFIDDILPIEYDDARFSAEDRSAADATVRSWAPDLVLVPIRSVHRHLVSVIQEISGIRIIMLEPDGANASGTELEDLQIHADLVIPGAVAGAGGIASELDHHAAFLRGLGDTSEAPVHPRLWTTPEDLEQAAKILGGLRLDPAATVTLFPSGRWRYKRYPHWAQAIRLAFAGEPDPPAVLLLGGEDARGDADAIQQALAPSGIAVLGGVGCDPLRTTLAMISLCRACIATDTFAIHAACAAGVPNALLLGGGHPGRFLPYDRTTHAALLPLDCSGCDWRCVHARAHCVEDMPPETLARAIKGAMAQSDGPGPRVYTPVDHPFAGAVSGPRPALESAALLTISGCSGR
jgi:ADP-heptose:LPS heptosyltransferase